MIVESEEKQALRAKLVKKLYRRLLVRNTTTMILKKSSDVCFLLGFKGLSRLEAIFGGGECYADRH